MRRARALGLLAAAAQILAGAALAGGEAAPVLDALLPEGRVTLPLDALAARVSLAPGRDFRLETLGRDAHTSHHVVAIRDREVPHRHDRHDLWVVLLRGHGSMRIGDEERPVGPRSVLYVPRATVHAFRNESSEPAVAYAVYAPPFDGRDRVDVAPGPSD